MSTVHFDRIVSLNGGGWARVMAATVSDLGRLAGVCCVGGDELSCEAESVCNGGCYSRRWRRWGTWGCGISQLVTYSLLRRCRATGR